jgi:hypothetical protein
MSVKFKNNVDIDGYASTNNLKLNTTPTVPSEQGTVYWSEDNNAIAARLNGYIQIIGEDQFYPVKNQTGVSIPKGTAVQFAGTLGMSGRLLIAPFIANGSVPSTFFMGVTAETIANGADGKVLWFGRITGINTNGFNEGDVLYASTTTAGGFQTTVPQAPNNIIQIAAVITKSATVGTIFVRPTLGSNINKDEGVKITSPATGNILQLQSNGLWENKTLAQAGIQPTLTNPVTGTGTTNYLPKFTGATSLGNSQIFDNGTNVGIGTTSPSGLLHLTGNSSSPISHIIENNGFVVNDSGTRLQFRFNGVETGFLYNFFDGGFFSTRLSSNGYLALQAGGGERLRITSGGQVNIGGNYTSTTNTLQVTGNAAIGYTNAAPSNGLIVAGNVGIGTSSPSAKLDVNGTAKISGITTLSNYSNGTLSVNESGVVQVEPTFRNLSLGESYANIIIEKYFREGFTVSPNDTGYQYAKLIQQDLLSKASILLIPQATKEGVLAVNKGEDLTVVRNTTATRVNADGLIEVVPANVARLDYTNGSCPSILVEPQRTNLVLRSEEFETANWLKPGVTVTANQIISPDGNLTADLITSTSSAGYIYPSNTSVLSSAGGGSFSYSAYLKAGTATTISLFISSNTGQQYIGVYNLSLGTASNTSINTTVSMVNMGNGWYRCILNASSVVNKSYSELQIGRVANGLTFYLWGAQLEAGSNATSYIKTEASAVTRNADVISKTGISDLIGQTEGTVLINFDYKNINQGATLFSIDNGTTAQRINGLLNTTRNVILEVRNGGTTTQLILSPQINSGNRKIAFAYKNGDYAIYINGALAGTSTNSTNFPTTALSQFVLSNASYGTLNDSYNLVAHWKTRLDNATLATLTTI